MAAHPLSEEVVVTGHDTRSWTLATRLPKWKIPGRSTAAVFWGSDDLFIPVAHPLTLEVNGHWNALSGSLPTECSDANVAAAIGEIAAIGNSPAVQSTAAVFRKSEAGFTSLHTLRVTGTLGGLRLSPHGRRLAAFSLYYHVISEETATGQRLPDCPKKPILASASADHTIRLWNIENGTLIEELRVPAEPQSLSFSPSGNRLASSDAKNEVSIWELSSSQIRTP